MVDDYSVEVIVRNNLLISKMKEEGISSIAELARLSGISYPSVCNLVNMKLSACKSDGEWRGPVLKLGKYFDCSPDELFAERHRNIGLEANRASAEMSFAEIQMLIAGPASELRPDLMVEATELRQLIGQALLTLTPREHRTIVLFFGLNGHEPQSEEEIGISYSATRMRVRDIINKALGKLRHPRIAARGRLRHALDYRPGEKSIDPFDQDLMETLVHI